MSLTFATEIFPNDDGTLKLGDSDKKWKINGGGTSTQYLKGDGTWDTPAGTYSLPTASSSTKGGIKVNGNGLKVESDILKHSNSVTAKTAFGSTATSASANGGSITVTDIKYDAYGHITGSQDREITLSQTTYTLAGLMGSSAKGSSTLPVYWTGSAFSTIDSLTLNKSSNPNVSLKNTTMDLSRAAIPSATQYNTIYMYDKNSYLGAYLQQYQNTSGDCYFYISARNRNSDNSGNVNNNIVLGVKADGTLTVGVSTPAGWRSAIGAVNKAGDTMTGNLIVSTASGGSIRALNTEKGYGVYLDSNSTAGNHGIWSTGYWNGSAYTASGKWIIYRGTDGEAHSGMKIYGAVWNDYAEMRNVPEAQKENSNLKPGMCIHEVGDGTMVISANRLERGCKIISDTFGFNIGETEECKTPIAVSGRVLVYINEGREIASSHIGWPVCSGPNGTVSIMTEEEEEKYPSRIIGTISEIPNYEEWGEDKVQVNGRIWIYVK